jgi:hypothetical protein
MSCHPGRDRKIAIGYKREFCELQKKQIHKLNKDVAMIVEKRDKIGREIKEKSMAA